MSDFKVGDLVTIIATKVVGTVIFVDKEHEKYLVRLNGTQQLYYPANSLAVFDSWLGNCINERKGD